ncbi:hypothetical protein E2C01_040344 [Portunus trituberculatus]|uniref:Uncharacterized protein n=1 Tax=Portunus trituberculatus TaxID=210409 RepID=A0A5B7FHB0_PORTR|nr:hypothetical protein [Portunus trituberculatus]
MRIRTACWAPDTAGLMMTTMRWLTLATTITTRRVWRRWWCSPTIPTLCK